MDDLTVTRKNRTQWKGTPATPKHSGDIKSLRQPKPKLVSTTKSESVHVSRPPGPERLRRSVVVTSDVSDSIFRFQET